MKRQILGLLGCIIILAGTLGAVSPAWSDWNPGDPYKWLQLPDTQRYAEAVSCAAPITLADDFQCTGTGPITDIHIWGAFNMNAEPTPLTLTLGIWTNIPEGGPNQPYSMPGELQWSMVFSPGQYQSRFYGYLDPPSQFLYPSTGATGACWELYQYNFFINPLSAFVQNAGEIYWLSVTTGPNEVFGWQSTHPDNRWMDGAVWLNAEGYWQALTYPLDHYFYPGWNMDLSFVITPIPATLPLLGSGLLGLAVWGYRRRRQ
jgi:hypothetical protein